LIGALEKIRAFIRELVAGESSIEQHASKSELHPSALKLYVLLECIATAFQPLPLLTNVSV
jgi:hypothetical protein